MTEAVRSAEAPARVEPDTAQVRAETAQLLALAREASFAATVAERRMAAQTLKTRVAALPGKWPGESVQQLLRQLLDDADLGKQLDGEGDQLRRTFVAANQALGFPWALELHPEDLKHLGMRPPREQPGSALAVFAFFAAAIALLWNGMWLVATGSELLLGPLFAIGTLHAVLACYALVRGNGAQRPAMLRLLRRLGHAGWLGPIAAVFMALAQDREPVLITALGLMVAAPSMLTAFLCMLIADRESKKDAQSLPVEITPTNTRPIEVRSGMVRPPTE